MLAKHRAQIDQCIDRLVASINIKNVWPKLFQYKIYNQNDVNISKWERNLEEPKIIEDIILTIKTRGPDAFSKFLQILRETHHINLANLLTPLSTSPICIDREDHEVFDTSDQGYDPSTPKMPFEINVIKSKKFHDVDNNHAVQLYPMRSKPRGVVLLISLIKYDYTDLDYRTAGEHDAVKTEELFTQMGFLVQPHLDLPNTKIRETLKNFTKQEILRQVDSCFVIICGHGSIRGRDSVILGIDSFSERLNEAVSYSEVVSYFSAAKCPNLINIPKIFIFATCRGQKLQQAVTSGCVSNLDELFHVDMENIHEEIKIRGVNKSVRAFSDILIVASTISGYASFRDTITGTWFVPILCDVFMNHACARPVTELFRLVDSRLSSLRFVDSSGIKYCQTSVLKLIGFKELYINPGFFGD